MQLIQYISNIVRHLCIAMFHNHSHCDSLRWVPAVIRLDIMDLLFLRMQFESICRVKLKPWSGSPQVFLLRSKVSSYGSTNFSLPFRSTQSLAILGAWTRFVLFTSTACVSISSVHLNAGCLLTNIPPLHNGSNSDFFSSRQGGKSAENSKRKIFIGGLPVNVKESELQEHFSKYGTVSPTSFPRPDFSVVCHQGHADPSARN